MGPRGLVGILLLVVLVAGAAGLAYNAGIAQGVAQSGQTVAPPGSGPYPYGPYYGPYWHHPFGFGFLFPLLFIFLFFGLLRGLFWHSWGAYRHSERGAPAHFAESTPPAHE